MSIPKNQPLTGGSSVSKVAQPAQPAQVSKAAPVSGIKDTKPAGQTDSAIVSRGAAAEKPDKGNQSLINAMTDTLDPAKAKKEAKQARKARYDDEEEDF